MYVLNVVELSISEAEKIELMETIDLREIIVEKNKRQKMAQAGDDELVATKQALKEVTEKMERMKEEMDALQDGVCARYALGFDPVEFNKLKFTESLQWVTTNIVVNMKQEMENHPEYFRFVREIGNIVDIGNKACAGYNRGSSCHKKWHSYFRQTNYRGVEELRLHCCALCMEALGLLSGHPIINCPWIKAITWDRIQG